MLKTPAVVAVVLCVSATKSVLPPPSNDAAGTTDFAAWYQIHLMRKKAMLCELCKGQAHMHSYRQRFVSVDSNTDGPGSKLFS